MEQPELSPEFFSAESGESHFESLKSTTEAVVTQMDGVEEIENNEDIVRFCQQMAEARDSFPSGTDEEELIIRGFFGIADEVSRESERKTLQGQIKIAQNPAQEHRLARRIEDINMAGATWQIGLGRMILMLDSYPRGEEVIKIFWGKMETILKQAFPESSERNPKISQGELKSRSLKNGILAPVIAIHIFNAIGINSSFPTPFQDARQSIDLWLWREENGKPTRASAVQIKSKSTMTRLEKKTEAEKTKERKEQQRLIRSAKKYQDKWGIPISPTWIEMEAPSEADINHDTGRPNEDYLQEQVEGDFGQEIYRSLRIKK
jgi:hypothetical protein